jgi:hypothetical protein
MARPMPTTISCPACRQQFNAFLERILDIGRDPTAKERLLSGRVNLITCPHCGYQGVIATPLFYHDPSKPLAIVYVPMELGLPQAEREKLIGDMTNAVMRSLPEDAPKGYLLQPKSALTLQGMVELVLEADGITQEVLQAQRRKVDLIDQLAQAGEKERAQLLAENQDLLDMDFLDLLTIAAQSASQSGDSRTALRLLNVRSYLMETTEAGQQRKAQEAAAAEAIQELRALGENVSREAFVDLLIRASDNPTKINTLATLARPLLDYSTFQMITERIEQAQTDEEKQRLIFLRERLLELAAEFEKQSRALIQRATDTLRMLLQASDIQGAIRANIDRIDELFLQVLQANLEEARRVGNVEASSRLRQIRDEVMNLIQSAAPPEVRLVNDLLSAGSEAESLKMLQERRSEITPQLLEIMGDLVEQLYRTKNDEMAKRLETLKNKASALVQS